MSLLEVYSALDEDYALHSARILTLLNAFAGADGSGTIDGLTKLAKLDFLLRYPVALERALAAKGYKPAEARTASHERFSVESSMIRFKYGPWDPRHRAVINLLVARGLATLQAQGRTVVIGLTAAGRAAAAQLAEDDEYVPLVERSESLRKRFDIAGTNLMKFIYETFPELTTLRYGEEIAL